MTDYDFNAERIKNRIRMLHKLKQSSKGAIDLASIMVGIVVIGLIGGVIAATVFTVIPWAQDNAAKQQLSSIATAQSAYAGFAASEISGLSSLYMVTAPAKDIKKFGNLDQLNSKGLFKISLKEGSSTVSADGKLCSAFDAVASQFNAAVVSSSGAVFVITSDNMSPSKAPNNSYNCLGKIDSTGVLEPEVTPPSYGKMVSVWDTRIAGCNQFSLPIAGANTDIKVDWGDGTVVNNAGNYPFHTYTGPAGLKTVTVDGHFEKWSSGSPQECIVEVSSWGETGTKDLSSGFAGGANLQQVREIPSGVTNISNIFSDAVNFNGDVSKWDTSKVTNMGAAFYNAQKFNGDISNWDTSNVMYMNNMFYNNRVFNGDISSWKTGNVVGMNQMFRFTGEFNGNISNWDTSKVTGMKQMFDYALKFNGDLSRWDTSQVTNMSSMFNGATAFHSDLSNWKTGKVADMSNMFSWVSGFQSDLSRWDTSNVTDMTQMFYYASSFNSNISNWNVGKITSWTEFKVAAALTDANTPVKFK